MTGVAVVNEGPDGEPVVVPIARFSLGEAVENPDMNLVWELISEAVGAIQAPFDDVFVRHYDIQFTFDGDELLRDIQHQVEGREEAPARVADRLNLDVAVVYEALAYYYANPEEMRQVDARHERAVATARDQTDISPPD